MATHPEAIKAFLTASTHSDLANLYSTEMEVQVNVAQDDGEHTKGEFAGRIWRGYTDGIQTWKPIRIPYNAATSPEYDITRKMRFDLSEHAEGIGMTGWNWVKCTSHWVAYDFDSIIGHSDKHEATLSAEDLQQVQEVAVNIPWVTVRQSTGGSGLHLYVFLNSIPTATHTEHAALGRAILSKMSAEAGFDFTSKVDACGQNMWVWHRKMKGVGLELLKQGELLTDIPINWKDHVSVIKGTRRKNLPQFVQDQSLFEEITSQRATTKLDNEHKKLTNFLKEIDATWWWDTDHQMLVCHTADLKKAHRELNLKGIYNTIATGKDQGDHNCYMFPRSNGSWVIRRYTPGVQETTNWDQDSRGWTRCYYNQEPNLQIAARTHDGVEDDKGAFHFNEAEIAATAAQYLGADLGLPNWACSRATQIKPHKDGRLIVSVKKESNDNVQQMRGWRDDKGFWKKIFDAKTTQTSDTEIGNFDNIIRHLVDREGHDYGWVLKSGNSWHTEPLIHIRAALKSLQLSNREIDLAIGNCIVESWTIVNEPFEDEYPGNRRWNRNAVQFCFVPSRKEPFKCPIWNKILSHVGSGLDEAVLENGWCQANGIITGGDYLRVWIASLFQQPKEPLPYLFFYSKEECTGKSTLHEALCLLITRSGYQRADTALLSQQAFNGELENVVLCIIQESDLRKGANVRNRLKDWVTSPEMAIHTKGKTPYLTRNTTHYIHTANNYEECPIFSGDTRITMGHVKPIDPLEMIPRKQLYKQLEQEASDFMATVLKMDIPSCIDRLNIPVVDTADKIQTGKLNRTQLEVFIEEQTHYVPGNKILYSEVYNRFQEYLPPEEVHLWSKIKLGRELPRKYPKGRCMSSGAQFYVGNISWTPSKGTKPLKLIGEALV